MLTFDVLLQVLLTFALLIAVATFVVYLTGRFARRKIGRSMVLRLPVVLLGIVALLASAAGIVAWQREHSSTTMITFERAHANSESNLLADTFIMVDSLNSNVPVSPPSTAIVRMAGQARSALDPQHYIASNFVSVSPGQELRYSLSALSNGGDKGQYQVRLLWYDTALSLLSWSDSPKWTGGSIWIEKRGETETPREADLFRTAIYTVPKGATRVRLEVRNTGSVPLSLFSLKLSATGAYVEQHPNGARGSVAFSFDWESAMGGPIHSRGMGEHDVASATQHGLLMRQGADWLLALFKKHRVKGTFYATGYNFLDGNTEQNTFSGDPIYKWASPKNRWSSDYWLTHKWFGDDPYGTVQSAPEWYFGDQTRALLKEGHEIASHTFGHLYVRGSNPEELATDMDEWLAAAEAIGVPQPSTFAFPWRSSNSLTPDFYDVLYSRGIRAVTRLYERDLRDLYTVSAVPTYTQMLVMPDFRLEAPTSNVVEEAAGEIIGLERGKQVLDEVIARRGTTSFWTHPEQLALGPDFEQVRSNWEGVVLDADTRRNNGLLWIGTVAEIIAYQRDVMSVTTRLEPGFLGLGDWTLAVHNDSGREIKGLTLTLPSLASKVTSGSASISTVRVDGQKVMVSRDGQPQFPTRQIVLENLPPGVTRLSVAWASGQEPPR